MTTASPDLTQRIAAAKAAVLAETGLLHGQFGKAQSNWKSDGTRVTPVDLAISANIFRALRAQFPSDQLLSEELPESQGPIAVTARFAWILDPIDGTNNFALGIPYCAIALALLEDGMPVYGVVYDLSRRSLMHGGPGFGAYDGEKPMRASTELPNPEMMVALHSPKEKQSQAAAQAILAHFKIRGLGSATLHLAYVAAGLFGGTADFNVKIWDLAAALPLCAAAGVEVCFLNGEQLPVRVFDLKMRRIVYVAGPAAVAERLRELVGASRG